MRETAGYVQLARAPGFRRSRFGAFPAAARRSIIARSFQPSPDFPGARSCGRRIPESLAGPPTAPAPAKRSGPEHRMVSKAVLFQAREHVRFIFHRQAREAALLLIYLPQSLPPVRESVQTFKPAPQPPSKPCAECQVHHEFRKRQRLRRLKQDSRRFGFSQ